jgi:hypothetical protein
MSYFSSMYGSRRRKSNKRKSNKRKSNKRKKSRGNKILVKWTDRRTGEKIKFYAKKKRKGSAPRHLRASNNRMKQLGKMYRNGEFGNMSWKSITKKYLSKRSKSRSKSNRRSRRSYRRSRY